MVFSSLVFLCVFFPLQMLIYYAARGIEARNTVLILFSLVFYAWGEPFFIVMLLFMCFADWLCPRAFTNTEVRERARPFWCWAA